MEEIVNKVASSGLITLDLEEYCDINTPRVEIDLKEILFQGMILRESDLRTFVKEHDWTQYQDTYVNIDCSTDSIIPTWAFMIITSSLQPFAKKVVAGDQELLNISIFNSSIEKIDFSEYEGKKIVLKGCGDFTIPPSCYVTMTYKLRPYASSIMFGEPCSTVPVYKRKKT
ncbi:MAG: DUF2480 family protein [Cyclobacteriaceae bacterium]|nr:DUF2480 family protein [Cyclobacteriaceae bacterium]